MRAILGILRQQYLGALALFIVLGGVATAATGDFLKLGASNSADKTTVLQSTAAGPGLDIRVPNTQPPLKVNSRKQVPQLNASLLGGKRPNDFAPATGSLNYLDANGPQVLFSGATGGSNTGTILLNEFLVPTDGKVTVVLTGHCGPAAGPPAAQTVPAASPPSAGGNPIIHGFLIKIGEQSRQITTVNGGCGLAFSADVTGPDTVSVEAQWSPSQDATFFGGVLVFFEPS